MAFEIVVEAGGTELVLGEIPVGLGGYQLKSEKGQPGGYAELDGGGQVPVLQLGTGTPDGTKYLRDDGVWSTPAGGAGGGRYTHAQVAAATLWTVDHNLGFLAPSVIAIDDLGVEFIPDVDYVNVNQLTIAMVLPRAGSAYINI